MNDYRTHFLFMRWVSRANHKSGIAQIKYQTIRHQCLMAIKFQFALLIQHNTQCQNIIFHSHPFTFAPPEYLSHGENFT